MSKLQLNGCHKQRPSENNEDNYTPVAIHYIYSETSQYNTRKLNLIAAKLILIYSIVCSPLIAEIHWGHKTLFLVGIIRFSL